MPLDISLFVHNDFPTPFPTFQAMYEACDGKTFDEDGSLYHVEFIAQQKDPYEDSWKK